MNNLDDLKKEFEEKLMKVSEPAEIYDLEVEFLGRKGKLTNILKSLSGLTIVEKKDIGSKANELKLVISERIKSSVIELKKRKWNEETIKEKQDINNGPDLIDGWSLNGVGHIHPLSNFIFKICQIFEKIGYEVVDGFEIETDYYNFTAVGISENHPARDDHDTFYVRNLNDANQKDLLLRTQTTAMQVRYMEDHKPPIKVIIPGKCYRRDDDATHFPMFHQFEALVIDKNINLGHLKSTLQKAMKQLLGDNTRVRFRSNYFPFTEPSLEVDVTCTICGGKGCRVCKKTGWLELLGAGMIHPQVLVNGGIDPNIYSGFAFGTGIERLCMMFHEINDIGYLFDNDLRSLKQF